jgi:hypothetical protein
VDDYKNRKYLSSTEAAKFLNLSVKEIHRLTREDHLEAQLATSGQKRYTLDCLIAYRENTMLKADVPTKEAKTRYEPEYSLKVNNTLQRIFVGNSMEMNELADNSVHLMITSPPYYNAKMYSKEPLENDLGNVHELELWFEKIGKVWSEVYRVLQPGRKAFINIMNLPIREHGSFRSLNLVGRTVELCEDIGFIFKRDIVWHKTNGVKAHFGTFPYPGGEFY